MKKLRRFLIPLIFSALVLPGCKKNYVDEKFNPVINPVIPDFDTKLNAGVNGFITDENGKAVEGATVAGGGTTVTTDKFGYFKIKSAPFAKSAGFVKVSKDGYFAGYRTFLPREGKENFIRLQLIPKKIAGSFNSGSGGTVTTTDGAAITLPADAVVNADGGSSYTGTVNVYAHWLNPAEPQTTNLTMPGDLTGVDTAGHLNVLQTFGMLAVELTGSSGQLLQIKSDKKASLSFPIPSSLSGIAPASIPLWYFDEAKGVWKQEGRAVKNGNSYEGEVKHFSTWNCDVAIPIVRFSAQLIDAFLRPLSNMTVSVNVSGQYDYRYFIYTDANGEINGIIPANSNLLLEAPLSCGSAAQIVNISTIAADVALGSIKIDFKENAATFKGAVNKCSGEPVTDGFVIIGNGINNRIINIENGFFEASGVICENIPTTIIAVDREGPVQGAIKDTVLNPGLTDFGILTACVPFEREYLSYSIDGGPLITYTGGSQYEIGANFYLSSNSSVTTINVTDYLNVQTKFQMAFNGDPVAGESPASAIFVYETDPLNEYNSTGEPVSVFISKYGLVGEFVDGTVNASVISTLNNSQHTLQCTFHAKRAR